MNNIYAIYVNVLKGKCTIRQLSDYVIVIIEPKWKTEWIYNLSNNNIYTNNNKYTTKILFFNGKWVR